MITTLEEIRKVKAMVKRACQQLRDEHKPCADLPIGMMLVGREYAESTVYQAAAANYAANFTDVATSFRS